MEHKVNERGGMCPELAGQADGVRPGRDHEQRLRRVGGPDGVGCKTRMADAAGLPERDCARVVQMHPGSSDRRSHPPEPVQQDGPAADTLGQDRDDSFRAAQPGGAGQGSNAACELT
ncbi:MAG: hypothetical protein ACLP70_06930 [Streptosporangiaceae bacterium]